jgi:hypothetical protein
MKDMKEIRILVTDIPPGWDNGWGTTEWDEMEDELYSVMAKYLSRHDFTISVWDVR